MPYYDYDTYIGNYLITSVLSIAIAALKYCLFPLIFANVRKYPITRKTYTLLCWGVNAVLWVFYLIIAYFTQSTANVFAYMFWTAIFCSKGKSILEKRGLLPPKPIRKRCPHCSSRVADNDLFCGRCGYKLPQPEASAEAEPEEPAAVENN